MLFLNAWRSRFAKALARSEFVGKASLIFRWPCEMHRSRSRIHRGGLLRYAALGRAVDRGSDQRTPRRWPVFVWSTEWGCCFTSRWIHKYCSADAWHRRDAAHFRGEDGVHHIINSVTRAPSHGRAVFRAPCHCVAYSHRIAGCAGRCRLYHQAPALDGLVLKTKVRDEDS